MWGEGGGGEKGGKKRKDEKEKTRTTTTWLGDMSKNINTFIACNNQKLEGTSKSSCKRLNLCIVEGAGYMSINESQRGREGEEEEQR